jgi:hypothetical protein
MSSLEILQACPSQRKDLLYVLGIVDPSGNIMIIFDSEKGEPFLLPPSTTFQIPMLIKNVTIHRCIIDEGASTCVM